MEREQVLEELRQRIQRNGGHILQTVKSLADDLQIKQERLYYLIRSFEQKGLISSLNHGPNGMELRIGSGEPKAPGRRGRAAAPAGARPAPHAPSVGRARFCPFCGKQAEPDWKFCASCGEELPTLH